MRAKRFYAWWVAALISVVGLDAANGRPPLVEAARRADTTTLRALLKQQVDVNAPETDGTTALHWAAYTNQLEAASLLIGTGAKVNVANEYGVTPLSMACTNGNAAIVAVLVKAGANLETRTSGETALMTAVRTGAVDVVKLLLDRGADVASIEPHSGQTMLMTAVAESHPGVARLLLARGADVQAKSKAGFTPLTFAARAGDLESVKLLLDAGSSPNEKLREGTTTLVVAIVNAHYEVARYLLDHGADPNADSGGRTALHALALAMNWDGLGSPDPELTGTGRLDARDLLAALLKAGANPNTRMTKNDRRSFKVEENGTIGVTPFWLAARGGDHRTMRTLAAAGADVHLGTQRGTTPLLVAAGVGFIDGQTPGSESDALESVKLMLELGANIEERQGTDPGCTPRIYLGGGGGANHDGWVCEWTALHGAATRGANTIVQFLADKGAKLDVKDRAGKTAADVAEFSSLDATTIIRESTARLLRKLMSEGSRAQR